MKVLKALSLVRTGSAAEAVSICKAVQSTTPPPTEESILNAMLLVYKATGHCTISSFIPFSYLLLDFSG